MSDLTRRRIAALILIAGAIVGGLAIADVGPFDDPPTVEEEVEAVVDEFFAAASSGNAKSFCGLLTADARSGFRGQLATLTGEDSPPGCEQGFGLLRSSLEGSSIAIRYVSVSGNRARVEAKFRLAKGPPEPRTIELLAEKGEWRISDPG
jgi:hypothetical protein